MILLKILAMFLMSIGMFAAVVGAWRNEGKVFFYGFFALALGTILW